MSMLFAHVSWMPEYSGSADERIFSTHGWVLRNNEAHEASNFKVEGRHIYGYLPIRDKASTGEPGNINIAEIGGRADSDYVDGVTVVWFANHPDSPKDAYIVGWYREARVFRDLKFFNNREYRISCEAGNATLISENSRKFQVPYSRSEIGRKLGYGYGQSNVWYAKKSGDFVERVGDYIEFIDSAVVRISGGNFGAVGDAIDDLDESSIGVQLPEKKNFTGKFIARDRKVREFVVARSHGKCEYCGELGFERFDGSYFVEAHHIITLAEQGPDTLDNVIALCPKHHRQAHFGAAREQLESSFLAKLKKIRGK